MAKGRKPLPATVKKARGNPGKRKLGNLPKISLSLPVAPEFLTEEQRVWFNLYVSRMAELGLASSSYTESIMLLAICSHSIKQCNEVIEKFGLTYETESTKGGGIQVKTTPEVTIRNDLMRILKGALAECGLTPSTAGRSKQGDEDEQTNPFAAMKQLADQHGLH